MKSKSSIDAHAGRRRAHDPVHLALLPTDPSVYTGPFRITIVASANFYNASKQFSYDSYTTVDGNFVSNLQTAMRSQGYSIFTILAMRIKFLLSAPSLDMQPSSRPSSMPSLPITSQPSSMPSSMPSSRPSKGVQSVQPTGTPTTVTPETGTGTFNTISFSSVTTMNGLDMSVIRNTLVEGYFITSIASTMPGVRPRDVTVQSITYVQGAPRVRGLRSNTHKGLAEAIGYIWANVDWTVTVAISRLGLSEDQALSAYTLLTEQLAKAMSGGTFAANLAVTSNSLVTMDSATVSIGPYVENTVINPTSSPTFLPTVDAVIPKVSLITPVDVNRTTINLKVLLVKAATNDTLGGNLYCIALGSSSVPTSVGSIKSAASDGSSSKGAANDIPASSTFPLSLSVNFTGLNSLQEYAIYCYVETSVGTGNSLEAVIATKILVTTTCCKTASFENSPNNVYGDVTKYESSVASLFIFTYALSDYPTLSVDVIPEIHLDGVLTSDVIVTPSLYTFTATSSTSGQFYLSAGTDVSGAFTVSLTFGGDNAADYVGETVSVSILSPTSLIPSPSMYTSQFTDSGQAVIITFDAPTDSAGIAATTWPCSELFVFTSADTASCTWLSATEVSVSFPVETIGDGSVYITPGSTITLLPDLLRAYCTNGAAACDLNPTAVSSTVVTLEPLNPSGPTIVVSAPLFLGSCTNLSLDATASYGNGGRLYNSVEWHVSAVQYSSNNVATDIDATAITNFLNAYSLSHQVYYPISVGSHTLTRGTYTFTLTLTNFLGLSTSSTNVVTVSSDPNVPNLTIIGPSFQIITASSSLSILSTATLSSCASSSVSVKYTWDVELSGVAVAITSQSLDPTRFSLPAYSLLVDKTYTITITATAGTSTSAVSVSIYVAHGTVKAAVVGGYTRSDPVDKSLLLDASISSDADVSSTAVSTLSYLVSAYPFPHIVLKSRYLC